MRRKSPHHSMGRVGKAPLPCTPLVHRTWVFSTHGKQSRPGGDTARPATAVPSATTIAGAAALPQQWGDCWGEKTALKYQSWCELEKPNHSEAAARQDL